MTTIRKTFVWKTDENGNTGWIPKTQPEFWASDARIIAHDTLEHRPKDTGSVDDELRAIGAVLFGRMQHDSRLSSDGLTSDLLFLNPWELNSLSKKKSRPLDCEYSEMLLQDACKQYRKDFHIDHRDEELPCLETIQACIRAGWRWARKRYGSSFYLFDLFDKVQTAAKRYEANLSTDEELVIIACTENRTVRAFTRNPWDNYND